MRKVQLSDESGNIIGFAWVDHLGRIKATVTDEAYAEQFERNQISGLSIAPNEKDI